MRLSPYREEWPLLYAQERERLEQAIGRYVLDIQHVGSTAVPGLPAKPIIDIGIAVRNFEEAAVCIAPIVALGYEYVGENGIPRRHYFRKGNPCTHHLHINEVDGQDWWNQIHFRDYLRQHPLSAQAYAALKMDLAQQFPHDREQYLARKGPFIEMILHQARRDGQDKPQGGINVP